jgi:hypothetical protein
MEQSMSATGRGELGTTAPVVSLLDGYLSEEEYARQRGVSIRTCQRDRALRQAPPYTIIGRQVYYRIEAVRAWMLTRERSAERQPETPRTRRGR